MQHSTTNVRKNSYFKRIIIVNEKLYQIMPRRLPVYLFYEQCVSECLRFKFRMTKCSMLLFIIIIYFNILFYFNSVLDVGAYP